MIIIGSTVNNKITVKLPNGKKRDIECCPICREPAEYLSNYTVRCSNVDCDLHNHIYPEYINKKIWKNISAIIKQEVYHQQGYIHKNVKVWNDISLSVKDCDDYIHLLKGMNI